MPDSSVACCSSELRSRIKLRPETERGALAKTEYDHPGDRASDRCDDQAGEACREQRHRGNDKWALSGSSRRQHRN